jgi:hypothetical protein
MYLASNSGGKAITTPTIIPTHSASPMSLTANNRGNDNGNGCLGPIFVVVFQ